MPRLKKKEVATPPAPEAALTLTAGRSRRTIKPNRKYLNDSIVSMPPSKTSSRSSSPDSDLSEDEYRKNARDEEEDDDDDDDEEVVVPPKSVAATRKGAAAAAGAGAKKSSISPGSKPRGRPPKSGKAVVKTEPVKNLRKEVMKKMDLTTLSVGKARVLLTPLKQDPKRKLNLDDTTEKEKPTPKAREPEKDKAREVSKQKVVVKAREPEKVPPAAVARERAKSEVRVVRKKAEPPPQATQTSKKEDSDALKKVINPVAVKKQQVEKSILDKRAKKVEEEEDVEEDDDDDDDDVQIVGISRETNPVLGRKTARKSPLVAKQISPLLRKVPGKPVVTTMTAGLKRKAEPEVKQPGRPLKNAKLSITVDSDDSSDGDVEEVEDVEEPVRRTTRSSLPSDKGSAASTPQNSSTGKVTSAKESPASARGRKETDLVKSSLTKSISMPSLDKSKQGLPGKSVQTPAAKALSKPMAASTPKPSAAALPSKSKSELNLVDPIQSTGKTPTSAERAKAKSATIRIVDIGDIIKKRAASTPDVRKDAYESSSSSDSDDGEQSKPKTNTELVASILERKQAVNVDHLRTNRPPKRGRPAGSISKASPKGRPSTAAPVEEEDEIDFEDMLQTNIVTANKVQKVMQPAAGVRQRRSDENINKRPGNNNNTLYKSNNNGRFGSSSSLNRSGSSSPHKNPPRILNSTMKMGDSRPFAKLVSNSGNKHYSIDLTDPDNNVKLVASPDSPPPTAAQQTTTTQSKRGPPVKTITRPAMTTASGGLRNAGNALNKPIGGAVQRSVSALTGSTSGSPKMKKITCYETWYVINIPNSENKPEKPSFAMSMIGLGNEADKIQLPSDEWSHKIILTKRKTAPADGDEVFSGDVEDRAISEEEKRNYEPCNIMFRRRTATPGKFNLQYDRAVIFKNDTFFINVDGKNCQLVGAPTKLDDTADIETLLSLVDFVNLKNTCVELSAA